MQQRSHKTILIVEDDPNDQMFIVAAFRRNGVQDPIHVASSGSEAIAYLLGQDKFADRTKYEYPGFILMDLKMPGGDGFSVLDFLRNHPERAIIPTVVLSASEDPDDVKRSYLLGASSYHIKPVSHRELERQLKILHEYWTTCVAPRADASGTWMPTDSGGKLGERFV